MDISSYIRDIPNYPKEGIVFKDITPLLQNSEALSYVVEKMAEGLEDIDVIVGLDARGFIFAGAIAYLLKKPLVIIRKTWKLPYKTNTVQYELEYGNASFDIHIDAIKPWQKVAIIDDLLATGWTVDAACKLVKGLEGKVWALRFVINLSFLPWYQKLSEYNIQSILTY